MWSALRLLRNGLTFIKVDGVIVRQQRLAARLQSHFNHPRLLFLYFHFSFFFFYSFSSRRGRPKIKILRRLILPVLHASAHWKAEQLFQKSHFVLSLSSRDDWKLFLYRTSSSWHFCVRTFLAFWGLVCCQHFYSLDFSPLPTSLSEKKILLCVDLKTLFFIERAS